MKKIMLVWMLFVQTAAHAAHTNGVYILIHGTWGADAAWYKTGSAFFKELELSASKYNRTVTSYTWTGKLNHKTRLEAGKQLAQLIQSYPVDTSINIISHSHGSNVGNLASSILAQDKNNKHSIDCFFAFGTPVHTKKYMPAMSVIKRYFNFYSYNDWVQPIFGFFDRTFPRHESIANLRIMIDCHHPSHRTILSPVVARWLPEIPDGLRSKRMGNFERLSFEHPGVVHFSSHGCPTYTVESKRSRTIDEEEYLLTMLASKVAFDKSRVAA